MNTVDFYQTKSSGVTVDLPLFIPVYRPDHTFELFSEDSYRYGLSAVMVNAFLLFKEQDKRTAFEQGQTLRGYIGGFGGMLCTDSGAFQQLGGRRVDIDPYQIVKFQNAIKTDVAAPLDLITPPETDYDEANRRMIISQYRVKEALAISDHADLAGIQQGGGFFELRKKHIRQLADIGINYYGIGSMVPFFNKNHDLSFTCGVISDARSVVGTRAPIHVYGAGDPLEIAFMFLAGANIFDSSSYAHYAQRGYYMTPYGAVNKRAACEQLDFDCSCPVCTGHDMAGIFDKESGEPLRKRHNLLTILETVRVLGESSKNGQTEAYVYSVYDKHIGNPDLFPGSMLARSWEEYLKGEKAVSGRQRFSNKPTDNENAFIQSRSVSGKDQNAEENQTSNGASSLTEVEQELLELLADESAGIYKLDRSAILRLLVEELLLPKNMDIRARFNYANSLRDARRLSEYKAFKKNIRSDMYRKLRRYKPSDHSIYGMLAEYIECDGKDISRCADRLLGEHTSTRERLPDRDAFAENIREGIKPGSAVIDIGCGFAPLLFPPEFFHDLSCFIAVDKDTEVTETVRIFAEKNNIANLKAYTWDISSGASCLASMTGVDHYDAALMLKLIPALYRTDRTGKNDARAIPVLGNFPAAIFLATVNRESMTKRESIEKRELGTLNQFARENGLRIGPEFSCGSETGYYLLKI